MAHLQGLYLKRGARRESWHSPRSTSNLLSLSVLRCFVACYLSGLSKEPLCSPACVMATLAILVGKDGMTIHNCGVRTTTMRLLFPLQRCSLRSVDRIFPRCRLMTRHNALATFLKSLFITPPLTFFTCLLLLLLRHLVELLRLRLRLRLRCLGYLAFFRRRILNILC